jgi:hypothetical protein
MNGAEQSFGETEALNGSFSRQELNTFFDKYAEGEIDYAQIARSVASEKLEEFLDQYGKVNASDIQDRRQFVGGVLYKLNAALAILEKTRSWGILSQTEKDATELLLRLNKEFNMPESEILPPGYNGLSTDNPESDRAEASSRRRDSEEEDDER